MRPMNFFPPPSFSKEGSHAARRSDIFRITLKMKVRSSKADPAADKSPRGVDLVGGGNREGWLDVGVDLLSLSLSCSCSRKITLRKFSDVEFPQRAKLASHRAAFVLARSLARVSADPNHF